MDTNANLNALLRSQLVSLLVLAAIAAGCVASSIPGASSPAKPAASTPTLMDCGRGVPLVKCNASLYSPGPSFVVTPSLASASMSFSSGPSASPASVAEISGIAFFDAEHGLLVGGSNDNGDLEPGGSGIVWRTDDGGTTWTKTAPATAAVWSVAVVGPSLAWASAGCDADAPPSCRPALLASHDGGRTWSTIASEAFATLDFVDANDGWGTGLQDSPTTSPLRHTTDGGRTWSDWPVKPCPTAAWMPEGVSFVDAKRGWVACSGDSMGTEQLRKAIVGTTDGGRTWAVLASAYVSTPDVGSIPGTGLLWGIAVTLASGPPIGGAKPWL